MKRPLRMVMITTDARHWLHQTDERTPNFGTAIRALLEGFREIDGVEVHVISASPTPLLSVEKLASNIWFHHVHVRKWGWGKGLFLGVAWRIRKLIGHIQPDVVHGQGSERDCAMAAVLSGYPNVLTLHGNMRELHRLGYQENIWYGRLVSILESFALRKTAGVFCNSKYTRDLVAPRAKQTWLVPNPIREWFFAPRKQAKSSRAIPRLLNVGMITPRKRQLELLRAVGDIVQHGHPMHLIFVGDLDLNCEYTRTFSNVFQQAHAAGHASHIGFLDAPDLIDLMDQSDGLIHFPTEEAFGLVVAEAMARGLKFFGANLGGIRDIAAHIRGAELYDDVEALTKGLSAWLASGAPTHEDAALQIAERYHPKVVAQRHLEIYQEVLGKPTGDP